MDPEGDKGEKTPNGKIETPTKEKRPCLYLCLNDGDKSPTNVSKTVEALGFKVDKKSDITSAETSCETTTMALIIVENCEDKAFIKGIKCPNACNEHTPIVFVSSGPLSDVIRDLMQEQYIDELVFNCLTLEQDLASAVNRLMKEQGQFAVTPKLKKPCSAKKRKLETAFPSKKAKESRKGGSLSNGNPYGQTDTVAGQESWQGTHHSGADIPMVPPFQANFDYNCALHVNNFMNSMLHLQQQAAYEDPNGEVFDDFHIPAGQMQYGASHHLMNHGDVNIPDPCRKPPVCHGNTEAFVKLKNYPNTRDLNRVCPSATATEHLSSPWQQLPPSVIVKAEDPTANHGSNETARGVTGDGIVLQSLQKAAGETSGALHKHSGKNIMQDLDDGLSLQLENPNANQRCDAQRQTSPSGENTTIRENTPRENSVRCGRKAGQFSAAERKEQHLDKEKKRRERVTRSWHWLRRLVPNCESYADKATVFEMTVAYLHHCWKYQGQLLQQINKDFMALNQNSFPPEDLEEMVSCLLEKERVAFGNIREFVLNTGK